MEIQEKRSPLRSFIVAGILFYIGSKIILPQIDDSSGFEYAFRLFSGYLTIALSVVLIAVTVYRTLKEILPKRD